MSRPRLIRSIVSLVYSLALVVWAVIPLLILAFMAGDRPFSLSLWTKFSKVWAGAFFVVMFLMLRFATQEHPGTEQKKLPSGSLNPAADNDAGHHFSAVQCMLGLLCTLSLGLPAIFLGAMPFISSEIEFFWQQYSGNHVIEIPPEGVVAPQERGATKYVIGIDASESFLGKFVQGQRNDDGRINEISQVILGLFGDGGVIGRSINEQDVVGVRVFAGGDEPIMISRQNAWGNVAGRNEILSAVRKGELRNWVSVEKKTSDEVISERFRETDLYFFLNSVVSELECTKYPYVKIIIFSDMKHSKAGSTQRGEQVQDFERLTNRIRNSGCQVSLVAFADKPLLPGSVDSQVRDFDPSEVFERQLASLSWQWQSIPLEEYHAALEKEDLNEILGLPLGLYSKVVECDALCLRLPFPKKAPVSGSSLKLPKGKAFDEMVVGLHGYPKNRTDLGLTVNSEEEGGFSLNLNGEAGTSRYLTRPHHSDILSLMIDNDNNGFEEGRYYLSLALPEASVVYRIALEPSEIKNEEFISALHTIFTILNLIPCALAFFVLKAHWVLERKSWSSDTYTAEAPKLLPVAVSGPPPPAAPTES